MLSPQAVDIPRESKFTTSQGPPQDSKALKRRQRLQSGGLSCTSPENSQSAVQLLFHSTCSSPRVDNSSKANSPALSAWFPSVPRLLPGAFQNHRTIFFFDWDDTLCPTTWIRSLLKDHMADLEEWLNVSENGAEHEMDWRDSIPPWFYMPLPDLPQIVEYVTELQEAVVNTINAAQAFGIVCIVTNAVPGWVEQTIKRWLPKLKQYIHGHGSRPPIRIIYGQEAYATYHKDESFPFVDDLGPHMWWKHAAMKQALYEVDELYRLNSCSSPRLTLDPQAMPGVSWCTSAGSKHIESVISVGDNEAEMQAATISSFKHESCRSPVPPRSPRSRQPSPFRLDSVGSIGSLGSSGEDSDEASRSPVRQRCHARRRHSDAGMMGMPRKAPWVKLLKLMEFPNIRHMRMQLEEIAEMIPQVVAMRRHLRVNLEDDIRDEAPLSPRSPKDLREKLLKCSAAELADNFRLRVQTA